MLETNGRSSVAGAGGRTVPRRAVDVVDSPKGAATLVVGSAVIG
ncbi:MAG: hypothetical protein R2706_14980 [Acidimicrobiales bacterium]